MKIYLVGGALRDKFLNIPIKDKDYVVVGSNLEEMEKKGLSQLVKIFLFLFTPIQKMNMRLQELKRKLVLVIMDLSFMRHQG